LHNRKGREGISTPGDTAVDAGGWREPGSRSDGVAAALGGGVPAPW